MESHPQSETVAGSAQVVLECPQCLHSCSPSDDECGECGFRFSPRNEPTTKADRTIHIDPASKKRYTNTVSLDLGSGSASRHRILWMLTNLVLGLVLATIGGLMAYAMPFGFECGMIFVFVGALFMLNVYLTSGGKYKRVEGCCPNCGALCTMSLGKKKNTGTDRCQKCSKLYHYDGERFEESSAS